MDLVDLGASGLNEETNAIWVQCKGTDAGSDYGQSPFMCSLGVSARPAPADDSGNAQGVTVSVPGFEGVLIGAFDPRSTDVFGELKPGETALHATGKGFDSRVLCKDQMLALVVGDDMVIVIDRKKKQIVLNAEGCVAQVGGGNGILLLDETGTAGFQAKGGVASMFGNQSVIGGRTPLIPVATQAVGANGAASLPATGVFVGV